MKKEVQKRLVIGKRRVLSKEEVIFNQEKRRLHGVYKRYKVGLQSWETISETDKGLLRKYFGVVR